MQRFYFHHLNNPKTGEGTLILEVTDLIHDQVLDTFKALWEIEILQAEREVVDVVTEDGEAYKNVIRYKIPISEEKVMAVWEKLKSYVLQRIANSQTMEEN